MYLLSLPNGARATVRSLAEQRKEGRMRVAAALRELEESRYLKRVVRKDPETKQLFTVYEVFDTPYDETPPEGDAEKVQNLAPGVSPSAAAGPLPSGEKTREEKPPSPEPPPSGDEPPSGDKPPGRAAQLLASLGRREPRLAIGAAEAVRLAPLVEEWWAVGASDAAVRAALTQGLPPRVYSAAALLRTGCAGSCRSPPRPGAPRGRGGGRRGSRGSSRRRCGAGWRPGRRCAAGACRCSPEARHQPPGPHPRGRVHPPKGTE